MGRGKVLSDNQIETIKATFAETGNYDAAAKAAGVSWMAARKYADSKDEYESLRVEKRVDIIAKIAEAQVKLIDSMVDPAHLQKATLHEKAVAFGIVTDKSLLMSGQPTSRTENLSPDPSARLSPDEMEAAARIRAKLAASVGE